MGVFTFLEAHGFKGKTIIPFVTYGLSGFGTSAEDIRKSVPGANVLDGLTIHASRSAKSQDLVRNWLKTLNISPVNITKEGQK